MIYTLITRRGREYKFYLRTLAEMYQRAYGGEITVDRQHEDLTA